MNDRERQQIDLIVGYQADQALRRANKIMNEVCANHSALGRLQSGVTIRETIRLVFDDLDERFRATFDQVQRVSASAEAFETIESAFSGALDHILSDTIYKTAKVASGRGRKSADESVWKGAQDLFAQSRSDLERRIKIASFEFSRDGDKGRTVPIPNHTTASFSTNKGGRPLAKHWDQMWADIAVRLWNGDLKPETQADIETAMSDWFTDKLEPPSPSTIRGRARVLWQRMAQDDS